MHALKARSASSLPLPSCASCGVPHWFSPLYTTAVMERSTTFFGRHSAPAGRGCAVDLAYPSKARVRASSSVGPLVKGSILASVILSLIFSFALAILNSSMMAVSTIM